MKHFLSQLNGKKVSHIDCGEDEEFVLVHFTDGTMWLIVATRWNCAGARLEQKIDYQEKSK